MTFELIEHTGDVGIRYFGSTLKELFSSAISGTAFVIGDPGKNCQRISTEITFTFSDYQDLLMQIIDRMIYFFEVEEILYDSLTEFSLHGTGARIGLEGCRIGADFQYRYILKAPTYHKMEINPEKGYGVQIYDI